MSAELNTEVTKTKVELNTELENEHYKIQVKGFELDGKYLFIKGIVLDIDKKEAFEFEDSIDISDFCSCEPVKEDNLKIDIDDNNGEQIKETYNGS